jgi:hypothetical protein
MPAAVVEVGCYSLHKLSSKESQPSYYQFNKEHTCLTRHQAKSLVEMSVELYHAFATGDPHADALRRHFSSSFEPLFIHGRGVPSCMLLPFEFTLRRSPSHSSSSKRSTIHKPHFLCKIKQPHIKSLLRRLGWWAPRRLRDLYAKVNAEGRS